MKAIKNTCFIFSALIITNTYADGYSQWGRIQELYYGSGGDYLRVTMDISDSATFCSESGKPYVLRLDATNETTKDFYKTRTAALLTAYAAGKSVRFYLATGNCSNGEPIIQGLGIK